MPAPTYVDRRNLDFLLHDVQRTGSVTAWPRFAAHARDTFAAALDAAQALADRHFVTHHRLGDVQEPRLVDGRVELPAATGAALRAYAEAGFAAVLADADDGGMQLPYAVALACDAMFVAANVSTAGYALLARGVANLLQAHAGAEQRARFLPPLREGRWLGTMCLSEPQAGSSLADIACRATPAADGTYRIDGAKMWISGGEHDLAENIVHLVLARLPDAPPGTKGLSLFVVPKFRVGADGTAGARNDVVCAGLNHKLGQRGIVNTFLKFGERGDCHGELVGAPGAGLAQMFHLMNEARIGVGVGAIMLGHAGYLASRDYARERRQGRLPDQKDPASPPVPLIEHADVRRMLLQQKAWSEGAMALAFYAAGLVDAQAHAPDAAQRTEAALLLELLTPVVKAWSADWCVRANDLAIQVHGGYGYTREFPVEQYWRDNRLNPIHEGANGIQAIDLLGRKLPMADGAALRVLLARIGATAARADADAGLRAHAQSLRDAAALLADTAAVLGAALADGRARRVLANAPRFMTLLGHVAVAWSWLRMALAARALDGDADADFREGKLAACRWFFVHELPAIALEARLLRDLEPTALETRPEWL